MASIVEFLVKVKDLASSPLMQIAGTGEKSFSRLTQQANSFSGKINNLGMSLNDIDRKLDQLQKTRRMTVDSSQLSRVNAEIETLERRKARLEGGGTGKGMSLMGLAGGAMAAAGAFAGAGSLFSMGMDREQTKLSFTTMMGGNEKRAESLLGNLNQFANATPFSNDEVVNSGKSLLAFGFNDSKIMPSLKSIGDVASGLKIPFGELTEIFGKAKTQGTLFGEDLNQMAGRGIPIFGELAKIMGVPEGQVKKLASESKVTFPMMEQAFSNMTSKGGLFENMMQKQSQTVGGRWSTVIGNAKTTLADFSEKLLPLTGRLVDLGGWMVNNAGTLGALTGGLLAGAAAYKAITWATTGWKVATELLALATGKMTLAQSTLNVAMLANPVTWVAAGVAALTGGVIYCWNKFEGFRGFLYGFWESTKQVFSNIGDFFLNIFRPVMDAFAAFQNPNLSGWEKTKVIGASMAKMAYNATPLGMAENLAKFTSTGGFSKGVGEAFRKGNKAGIEDFRREKAEKTSKGADEIASPAATNPNGLAKSPALAEATNGITGGGVRTINISIGKMVESIAIHSSSMQEGFDDFEQKVLEVLMRVTNSAASISR
ncbi:tape measure protein [Rufibacter immobilis]|uniref:tape measure protein n=1 Tax=Rufibacter immobilis TaxID=1348778 RepID=UPI0035ED2BCB